MQRRTLLVTLVLPIALAACGSSSKHPASTTATVSTPASTPATSPSTDNYFAIACTQIDQGRAKLASYTKSAGDGLFQPPGAAASAETTATNDYLDALHDFQSAVQSAAQSTNLDTRDRASSEYVGTLDPDQLASHLTGWRSFCESKGWVGTP